MRVLLRVNGNRNIGTVDLKGSELLEEGWPRAVSSLPSDWPETAALLSGLINLQGICSVHHGLGQPFLLAVLDRTPNIIADKNAKGELVVIPARKKAKHRIAKIVQ